MTACSSTSKRPLNTDEFTIDILSDSNVAITQAVAKQSEGSVLIDGKVRRKVARGRGVVKGYVEVTLLNNEGQILHQTVAECDPQIIPNRGTLTSSFSAQIPVIAAKDSLVRLKFRTGPHSD